jgi:hypothetical protein
MLKNIKMLKKIKNEMLKEIKKLKNIKMLKHIKKVKKFKIFIIFIICILALKNPIYATENLVENEEVITPEVAESITEKVIESAKNTFGISDFLKQAKKYIENNLEDINLDELLSNSIKGNYSNNWLKNIIWKLFGTEVKQSIQLMVNVLLIIVVHSIMKAIIENLGNSSARKNCIFCTIFSYSNSCSRKFCDSVRYNPQSYSKFK